MLTKLLGASLLLAATLFAQMSENPTSHGRPANTPESFYIAGFDNDRWMIVDVQQASAAESKVRFIQVYRACTAYHVREEDYIFEDVSVQDLAQGSDICSSPEAFAGLLKPYQLKRKDDEAWWDTWWADRQGIEAQCGSRNVIHHLAATESLRFAALKEKAPGTAALWTLAEDIRQRYKKNTGQDISAHYLFRQVQRLGIRPQDEQAAIDIRAGHYDLAMPEIPEHWQINGQSKLSLAMPDPEEAASEGGNFGTVENAGQLGLEESVVVPYPSMAAIAHIQGDVRMEVYIDAESGLVMKTVPTSGHPILQLSADEAVKKWKFIHPYLGKNPLSVVIHFQVSCPPIIETTTTHKTAEKSHKVKPGTAPKN